MEDFQYFMVLVELLVPTRQRENTGPRRGCVPFLPHCQVKPAELIPTGVLFDFLDVFVDV